MIPPIADPAKLLLPKIKLNEVTGSGSIGAPTNTKFPSTLSKFKYESILCSADTQSKIKCNVLACFAICSGSVDKTTSSAPKRFASSVLDNDVVKTTT
ncbi:hypothetical protein D3C86_836480 [compost metagenome]